MERSESPSDSPTDEMPSVIPVIRLKSQSYNTIIPEITGTTIIFPPSPDNSNELPPEVKLQHSVSMPIQGPIQGSIQLSSTQIKPSELPEFRLRNANIDTTAIPQDGNPDLNKFKLDNGPRQSVVNPFAIEYASSASIILSLLDLRDKYIFQHCQYTQIDDLIERNEATNEPSVNYLKEDRRLPKMENAYYRMENGVIIPYLNDEPIVSPINMDQYLNDLMRLIVEVYNSANKSYCYKRLNILEEKYKMYLLFNQEKEILEQRCNQERDFYNVRKVDTHIHHSAFMNVNLLIDFIKRKVKEEPNRPVIKDSKTGKTLTLLEVFQKHRLNPAAINVGVLDMQAGFETFQRFDRFNKKYNPFSQTEFREIFLKTDNLIGGEYLAEITKEVFHNYKTSKYQYAEPRISIYGKSCKEWEKLAEWFDKFGIYDHHARWIIQIPRIYEVYRQAGVVENFQQMIDNIFKILFDVTINPDHNPKIYKLLLQIVGFDSVDDESVYEKSAHALSFKTTPAEWNYPENPHYCYWAYYLWANICTLNHLRKARGLNSFAFRPHCGEAGSPEHLMAAYLLADGINHGIRLEKAPVLEYLFYLKQIGVAMSPLSNNKLFLKYSHNPLPKYFARGLNVSLSTDDPLIFHMTNEPLMEEYSISTQVYGFNSCDVCEIARNSVMQSGFEDVVKKYWLGKNYNSKGEDANCFEMSNIANVRYKYRRETLKEELHELETSSSCSLTNMDRYI